MSQKSIILVIVVFVLIIIGMFTYANLKKGEIAANNPPTNETSEKFVPYSDVTRVDAKHYFIEGMHTLVGEINFPTPCDLLEADAVVMESFPEQVAIKFNVIGDPEYCERIPTAQRFKVEAQASAEATFTATFMGRDIELNLIPAAEGELPEDFEVFIKG